MDAPLAPAAGPSNPDALLEQFLAYAMDRGLDLYPAQEEAILELFAGKNVILNTPTGSGKSLVAAALHFLSASTGQRSVYTCPIKALVNEKFLSLCRDFGPEQVGMMTGDASVNRSAPILCCTAEILANMALREGEHSQVSDVIMDEFHYYSDPERGMAWQVPLLTMPRARFLLMSATLGDTTFFKTELERVTGRDCSTVSNPDRPVPLEFSYLECVLTDALERLKKNNQIPVYVVHFTQRAASETAQSLLSMNFCTKEEKQAIKMALAGVSFNSPFGKDIKKLMLSGIGLHHAGLLPKYRVLVEKLVQQGLLKVVCGTDTLGVGVNVPIRTVLLTQLCKYDGRKTGILTARDFHQISGRAGRKGFDNQGQVVALAPAHVVENKRLDEKATQAGGKKRKVVKRKPPERGYVHWDEETFLKLQASPPEALKSSFRVSHGMLLNVLGREGDGCGAMRSLIRDCHEPERAKPGMRRGAFQAFRALVDRNIIEVLPRTGGDGPKLRVNMELQDEFSLNQTLALYLLDALGMLNTTAPEYVYRLLSLIEAILENPEVILRRQLDRVKREKVNELKADGVPYEERMEILETLDYPKPEADFIYETFNQFAREHPWVGNENIKPKSIAREMFETYASFSGYIKHYGLMRAEGLLLRHLGNVYRVLVNTVPPVFRTEPVQEAEAFLEQLLRATDSSLLEEWESMQHPERALQPREEDSGELAVDITRDRAAFMRMVRNEVFGFLNLLAAKRVEELGERFDLSTMYPDAKWPERDLADALESYCETHGWIRLDPAARSSSHTLVEASEDGARWTVAQTLIDPDEQNDVEILFDVDLEQAREEGVVRLQPLSMRPIAR